MRRHSTLGYGSPVRLFLQWGYTGWFLGIVTAVEVGGLLALWIPGLRRLGAAALGIVMIGATVTLATHQPGPSPVVPGVFLALLSTVAIMGRTSTAPAAA